MCGRYASDIAIDDMMKLFGAEPGTAYDWAGRYSIAPSTRAPIAETGDLGRRSTTSRSPRQRSTDGPPV